MSNRIILLSNIHTYISINAQTFELHILYTVGMDYQSLITISGCLTNGFAGVKVPKKPPSFLLLVWGIKVKYLA